MPALNLVRADIRQIAEPGAQADNEHEFVVAPPAVSPANDAGSDSLVSDLLSLGRKMARSERETQAVLSRAAALTNKFEVERLIDGKPPLMLGGARRESEHQATSTGRAAALADNLNRQALAHNQPPNESEHLRGFEEANRAIVELQHEFATKWKPVEDFVTARGPGGYAADELHEVIAATGDPAEYDSFADKIKELGNRSADHLEALTQHLSAYRRVHGDDEAVEEVAERVQDSWREMAQGKPVPKEENGEIIEDVIKRLRELIERFVEMLRKVFEKVMPK